MAVVGLGQEVAQADVEGQADVPVGVLEGEGVLEGVGDAALDRADDDAVQGVAVVDDLGAGNAGAGIAGASG